MGGFQLFSVEEPSLLVDEGQQQVQAARFKSHAC